ncbi:efflux RND transporter periplasmic adaptor subunit [Candidatus Vondammii sp. HM_W22]
MGINLHTLVTAASFVVAATLPIQSPAQVGGSDYFTVQQARGAPTVSLGGTVIPYKEVTLSAQLPGRVETLAGIEGDSFTKGTLLVSLDDTELLAKRNAAIAAMANADAQVRMAGVQYSRELWAPQSKSAVGGMGMPNLFDQMFTSPMESFSGTRSQGMERRADLYSQGVQITQAQNSLMAAQSQIQAIDAKLRDARSLAPFDGVIMRKYIEVGDTMQPGQPLLVFADVEYLQVLVDVPARLCPGLSEGMMLQAQLDVGNQVVPVRVAQIFPMADAQRHTVKVKFDLPQGVSAPGMYSKVIVPDFTAPTRNYPVIPVSAIRYNGSLPGVYVQGENDQPELRLIRVGEKLDGGYISVLSGLSEGERILRNPQAGVSSGWSTSSGGRY